jgi:hypothetical protein
MKIEMTPPASLSPQHRAELAEHCAALATRYGGGALMFAQLFHDVHVGVAKLMEGGTTDAERLLARETIGGAVASLMGMLTAATGVNDQHVRACMEAMLEFERHITEDVHGLSAFALGDSEAQATATLDRMRCAGL